MVIERGQVWWVTLPQPTGSGPGLTRPVVVVQADEFNQSAIRTVVVVPLTSTLRRAGVPGNVLLKKRETGLEKDSVANVSAITTVDRTALRKPVRSLARGKVDEVDAGLLLVLGLRYQRSVAG